MDCSRFPVAKRTRQQQNLRIMELYYNKKKKRETEDLGRREGVKGAMIDWGQQESNEKGIRPAERTRKVNNMPRGVVDSVSVAERTEIGGQNYGEDGGSDSAAASIGSKSFENEITIEEEDDGDVKIISILDSVHSSCSSSNGKSVLRINMDKPLICSSKRVSQNMSIDSNGNLELDSESPVQVKEEEEEEEGEGEEEGDDDEVEVKEEEEEREEEEEEEEDDDDDDDDDDDEDHEDHDVEDEDFGLTNAGSSDSSIDSDSTSYCSEVVEEFENVENVDSTTGDQIKERRSFYGESQDSRIRRVPPSDLAKTTMASRTRSHYNPSEKILERGTFSRPLCVDDEESSDGDEKESSSDGDDDDDKGDDHTPSRRTPSRGLGKTRKNEELRR